MSATLYRYLCGLWMTLICFPAATVGAQQTTSPKPVSPVYAITELPTLGTTSEANAINNKGQIVGWTQSVPNHHRAVLWQNTAIVADLGTLGGTSSEALALNDNGHVVGRITTADGKSVAFVWQDYVMRRLSLPDSSDSAATGINANGQIVGYRSVSRAEKAGKPTRTLAPPRAFLWQQGHMTDLYEVGTGGYSFAAGINAAGKVVGSSAPGNLNGGVFVWTSSGKWNFSDYVHVGGHRGAGGTAINDAGDVVGDGMVGNDSQDRLRVHAFLQRRREAIDLGGFGEGSTRALALNNKGQVVGTAFTMQGNTEQGHRAFLWQNGSLTDLNDAVKANSGWMLEEARGINDKGQIVGFGAYKSCRRAFLLTPVSAPDSISINKFHRIVGARIPIRLNGIASGVRLYAADVYWNGDIEHSGNYRELILERSGRKQITIDLNQLHGNIHITDKRSALRYARLRTTPKTFSMFRPLEVEIVSSHDHAQMPFYGLKTNGFFMNDYRGYPGILSNREYRIGKITPPRVRRIAEGFVINRWTYSNDEGLCYVQELVGKDGAYRRRALKKDQEKLQKLLPDVQWELPNPLGVE